MHTKMNVTRHSVTRDDGKFNIYNFMEKDELIFYIEREGYNNLYYICNVSTKDKIDNIVKFIDDNIENWIFFVMNETEED